MSYEIHVCPKCGTQLPNGGDFFCHVDKEIVKARSVGILTKEQCREKLLSDEVVVVATEARGAEVSAFEESVTTDQLEAAADVAFGDER